MLGIKKLIVSNASGGVNPAFDVGEIMILNDHINLLPDNPLIGKNHPELGPRFPDMSCPYNPDMIQKAQSIAAKNAIKVSVGTYAALTGPTLETPAEYRYMRAIGADAVGMSTVPEVIVARHMEIPVFAISIITDLGVPGKIKKVSLQDVIEVASKQEPKMTLIIKELIAQH
jgi:purine-nucleoside phosphorylase